MGNMSQKIGIFWTHSQRPVTTRIAQQESVSWFTKTFFIWYCDKVDKIHGAQPYLSVLYKTVLITGYYGLFCIGEITKGNHPIQARDVHIASNKQKILLMLRSSKTHDKNSPPQTVKITSLATSKIKEGSSSNTFCPYNLLWKFIAVRPKYTRDDEQFFIFRDGSPVTSVQVVSVLKRCLSNCRMTPVNYSGQSLRVGRAGDLLKLGVSVETIKNLGRWRSNAVYKYLKV